MRLTRYEFGGTGIFHAVEVLESMPLEKPDEEDLEWAKRQFDEYLEVPVMPVDKETGLFRRTRSYFTDKGLEAFKDALDILVSLFYMAEDAGLGELKVVEKNTASEEIFYEDENQVVVFA